MNDLFSPSKLSAALALAFSSAAFLPTLSFADDKAHNYAEALQKSIYFYDIQRSGDLSEVSRVPWRTDSTLNDGQDVGVDLSKGFYDAGDNIKFNFPMAATATMLAWGVLEFLPAYEQTGQLEAILSNLKWVNDYLKNTVVIENGQVTRVYGQVAAGNWSHSNAWAPYEALEQLYKDKNSERLSYYVTPEHPGSDLAGSTAAATAAAALVFSHPQIKNSAAAQRVFANSGTTPEAYAEALLVTSETVYRFADQYRGLYHDHLGREENGVWKREDPSGFYKSWSGYEDELAFAAAWLALANATGMDYLTKAQRHIDDRLYTSSTQSWDEKQAGTYILLSKLMGDDTSDNPDSKKYHHAAKRYLNNWSYPCDPAAFNEDIKRAYQDKYNSDIKASGSQICTPDGQARNTGISRWGSNRYVGNTAFMALIYAKLIKDSDQELNRDLAKVYYDFAKGQVDFLLGDNRDNFSYLVGYGDQYALQPHHATGQGAWNGLNNGPGGIGSNDPNRHILYGALVGGPTEDDGSGYRDDRQDYIANEVAVDYNSGITGALAALNQYTFPNNGQSLANFPNLEDKAQDQHQEYFAGAYVFEAPRTEGDYDSIGIQAQLYNHSAWPARLTYGQSMRFYFNLANGQDPNQVKVRVNHEKGLTLASATPQAAGNHLYYIEFKSDVNAPMYPGGLSSNGAQHVPPSFREVQFKLQIPANWDHDFKQDWSLQSIPDRNTGPDQQNLPPIANIAVYGSFNANGSNAQLLGGQVPNMELGSLNIGFQNVPQGAAETLAQIRVDGVLSTAACSVSQGCDLENIAAGAHQVSVAPISVSQDQPRQDLVYNFEAQQARVAADESTAVNFRFDSPQVTSYHTTQLTYSLIGAEPAGSDLTIQFTAGGKTQSCTLPATQTVADCELETVQSDNNTTGTTFTITHPQVNGYELDAASSTDSVTINQGVANPMSISGYYQAIPTYHVNLSLDVAGSQAPQGTVADVLFDDQNSSFDRTVGQVAVNGQSQRVDDLPAGLYTVTAKPLQINGVNYVANPKEDVLLGNGVDQANVSLTYTAVPVSSSSCTITFDPVYSSWMQDGHHVTTLQMNIESEKTYQAGEWSLTFLPSGNDADGHNPNYVKVLDAWGWSPQVSDGKLIGGGTDPSWQNFGPNRALYFGMNVSSKNQQFQPGRVLLNGLTECTVNYK